MDWQLGELNVRAFALVVLLALLPVAADAQGTRSLTDEALKQHAQNKVKYDLLDPDATQFREIELFSRTNPETGEVSRSLWPVQWQERIRRLHGLQTLLLR